MSRWTITQWLRGDRTVARTTRTRRRSRDSGSWFVNWGSPWWLTGGQRRYVKKGTRKARNKRTVRRRR